MTKPTQLPTGTVTLLFTDIEGSTRLLHALGEQRYGEALASQRDLLRASFERWNGVEVDTQGDSFFVVFPSASDALSAAAEGQLALSRHRWPGDQPLRVRMGLHTGEPEPTATGYVGVDVHRAARISAVAYGGQVLLSAATRQLTGDSLPERMQLVELGHYSLKDLTRPEHLYELRLAELPSEFPPLRSSGTGIANLPAETTSFVGRQQELEQVAQLMVDPDCRILTLLGPGGVGKTRLAMECAARQVHSYADGAYFVALAPLRAAEHLVPTIANSLNFPFDTHSSDLDPKSQLMDYLSGRSVLLLMDNFEHLVKGAGLLAEIAERAPGAKLLVTSRERLNLQGEWTFGVEGMRYPTNGDASNLDQYSALQLFRERARQVSPGFELSEELRLHASRICHLMDGMPLGIELATAWIPMLSCREIAEEIEKNLDFLGSQRSDLPDRHRSLRAAFDHSWNLLPPQQQAVLPKLSVFRGGFTRQAAEQVAGADLRMLAELVSKSLIHKSVAGRYEIHELLRQYARERLEAAPGEEAEVRQRQSQYYLDFLRQRQQALSGADLQQAKAEIREEFGNLRLATNWCLVNGDDQTAQTALLALRSYYWVSGWHEGLQEASQWVEAIERGRLAESPGAVERDPVYLTARVIQAGFMTDLGQHEESEVICRAELPTVRKLGQPELLAATVTTLAINAALRGEYRESIDLGVEAHELTKISDQEVMRGSLLLWTGWDHYQLGEYEAADREWTEGYQIFKALGNEWALAFALSKLGLGADALKDYQQAVAYHQEARETFVKLGDQAGEAYTLSRLSISMYAMGKLDEAIHAGRQGLELFEGIGHRWGIGVSMCRIGFPVLKQGDPVEANRLFAQALQRALEFNMEALALYALGGLASVLTSQAEFDRAAEVFTVFLAHPVTPPIYKETVQPYVDQLRAEAAAQLPEDLEPLPEEFSLEEFARTVLAMAQISAPQF